MDPAAPQSRLLAGWQPDVQRLLPYIVPMLSAELRHTFRDFVKGLTAKRDAREIPSLSAALMEQAPQVVGADLWQQCIDRQREAAARGTLEPDRAVAVAAYEAEDEIDAPVALQLQDHVPLQLFQCEPPPLRPRRHPARAAL